MRDEPPADDRRLASARFFDKEPPSPSRDMLLATHSCDSVAVPKEGAKETPSSFPSIPKDVKKDITKFQLEDYAKKYFQTRKKGIFKKKVPIQEMLTFQKVCSLQLLP